MSHRLILQELDRSAFEEHLAHNEWSEDSPTATNITPGVETIESWDGGFVTLFKITLADNSVLYGIDG